MELQPGLAINLFSGVIGEAIESVNLYAAYIIGENLILDGQPVSFSVNPEAALTAL